MIPDPNILLSEAVSVAAAAVSPNGTKTLLANCLNAYPVKGNQVFSSGPESLLQNLRVNW